jgi:hypothetical protein
VAGGLSAVARRNTGLEGGDEGAAEGVWSDALLNPAPSCDLPQDPRCGVPLEAVAVGADEDGA